MYNRNSSKVVTIYIFEYMKSIQVSGIDLHALLWEQRFFRTSLSFVRHDARAITLGANFFFTMRAHVYIKLFKINEEIKLK